MQTSFPPLTHEANEIVAETNRKDWVYLGLFFLVISIWFFVDSYNKNWIMFTENLLATILLSLVILGFLAASLYLYFDKGNKLVINKNGIWTSKHGELKWEQIWYYHIRISDDKYKNETLRVKQRDTELEIIIPLGDYNITKEVILSSFKYFSSQYSIQDLGIGLGPEKGFFRK